MSRHALLFPLSCSPGLFVIACLCFTPAARAEYDATRWQEEMKRFEAADRQQDVPSGGVVFVGSSSIRMWDLQKSFPGENYLNRGFGGSVIKDSTHYFDLLLTRHKPRFVVLYAGDNDAAAGNSAETVYEDFAEFVKLFKKKLPESHLVFIAIKPSLARWQLAETMKRANAMIAADCGFDEQMTFVDVWPGMLGENGEPLPEIFREDGLHMNDRGYAIWNELLKPVLEQK